METENVAKKLLADALFEKKEQVRQDVKWLEEYEKRLKIRQKELAELKRGLAALCADEIINDE